VTGVFLKKNQVNQYEASKKRIEKRIEKRA
jgi:hypothetical protein